VLAVFVERDDLHRNMPGERIVLELAQHRPAQHVRQEHVERHRRRLELFCEFQGLRATRGDQNLESLVTGEVDQHARVMRVVLDDQQDGISGFEIEPVIRQLFDDPLLRHGLQCRHGSVERRGRGPRRDRRAGIFQRQIEHEGAALAGRTAQVNFAAEQGRKLAADRQP